MFLFLLHDSYDDIKLRLDMLKDFNLVRYYDLRRRGGSII